MPVKFKEFEGKLNAEQQKSLGSPVAFTEDCANLQPGDLIFWQGEPYLDFQMMSSAGGGFGTLAQIASNEVGWVGSGTGGQTHRYTDRNARSASGDIGHRDTRPWCSMFCMWCLIRAGIEPKSVNWNAGCTSWLNGMKSLNRFNHRLSGYIPKPGDITFYNWNKDMYDGANHVSVVVAVGGGKVGNVNGNGAKVNGCASVSYKERSLNDSSIVGWGIVGGYGALGSAAQQAQSPPSTVAHVGVYLGAGYIAQTSSVVKFAHITRVQSLNLEKVQCARAMDMAALARENGKDNKENEVNA